MVKFRITENFLGVLTQYEIFGFRCLGLIRLKSCLRKTWDIMTENQISAISESSRPRELPPQPLTESDMNLSIHPALIDQPIVAPLANVQTDMTSVWRCAQASKKLCVCDGVTFCISAWPNVAMRH